jgi:hypothetical protein
VTAEEIEALAFHLRELQSDIAGAIREVARVRGPATAESDATPVLSEIAVTIEHDLDHHAAAALDLARGIDPSGGKGARRPDDEATALSDERWRRIDEALTEPAQPATMIARLSDDLARLAEQLGSVATALTRIDARRPAEGIAFLEEVRAELSRATDVALAAVRTSTWLARLAESPEERSRRQREQEMTEALATRTHAEADRLTACPSCGAALGGPDRTTTGSFCESCRTDWKLPSASS